MRSAQIALASAALITLSACVESASPDPDPGAVVDVVGPDPLANLYSPESRPALALGLPDQIGGIALAPSSEEVIAAQERDYTTDSRIRRFLVARGLGPERVVIEHKTAPLSDPPSGAERIPSVGLAAVQVKQIPAEQFEEWDPTFYLLLSSVDADDYTWQGEKPGRDAVTIADRDVWLADFGRFKVAWYPHGDVLYIAVAANDLLLEAAISRMPGPDEVA